MDKIIIGIDPDSSKHGVAIYKDGKLWQVVSMTTLDFYLELKELDSRGYLYSDMEIHIENPCGNSSSAFSHKRSDSMAVKFKKSEHVGMCKHAQKEVEVVAVKLGIKVVHHKVSSMWKSGSSKEAFTRITGWNGRSNEDSRSAAWFGYLGCQ